MKGGTTRNGRKSEAGHGKQEVPNRNQVCHHEGTEKVREVSRLRLISSSHEEMP